MMLYFFSGLKCFLIISHFQNVVFTRLLNYIIISHFKNVVFTRLLLWLEMFLIISHFQNVVFTRLPLRQPTHRSSLLEVFCCFSTPYWRKYFFPANIFLWAGGILANIISSPLLLVQIFVSEQ